jgi:hypothetical protein
MPKGSIIITTLNKLRPGGGLGFKGISIVDTSHEQKARVKGVIPQSSLDQNQPDPETVSYPIALAASNVPPRYPSGILSRADPETGNLPRYERDDEEVITRLFGIGTRYYNPEIRDL